MSITNQESLRTQHATSNAGASEVASAAAQSSFNTDLVSQSNETKMEASVDSKELNLTQPFEDGIEITSLRYPVPDLSAGQVFGRYRIESELGRGGMGAVYRAYDCHLQRTVALKVPFFKRKASTDIVTRFLREARAVARLSHANLCRVFDVGVIDGMLFLTMEFIEGKSLEQLFESGQSMPEADVIAVIRQVALALQEAHDCGIIHRDMKPANIMLNTKGQAVLMDFGLARQVNGEENDVTKDGTFLGTPAYMSPEQIRGASREIGPATDIYSLGVVMYRLLTGRRPFEGTFTAIVAAIPTKIPSAPREHCGTISTAIEAICLKAMAKAPADRFASAAEIALALDEALPASFLSTREMRCEVDEETIESMSMPVLRTELPMESAAGKLGRKSSLPIIGGMMAVAALLLFVAWLNRGGNPPASQPTEATSSLVATPSKVKADRAHSGDALVAEKHAPPQIDATVGKPNVNRVASVPILETHLQRARQQQGYEVLSQKSLPLHAHDKLQFHVKLSVTSYVYLYLIDTNGVPERLWPKTAEDLDQQKPVAELWAPPLAPVGQKQDMYFLDELNGQETVLVATSQRALSLADLQSVEAVRLKLGPVEEGQPNLVSFRRAEKERGIGGIVETDKALPVEFDRFTERLSRVFDGYTGIVFPHE
ncbi:MAG: protein kinase [Planctomycetaceae bacterium]|nr:protein kinase [Planctomycetaceae bacterium]